MTARELDAAGSRKEAQFPQAFSASPFRNTIYAKGTGGLVEDSSAGRRFSVPLVMLA
jgi:hypothetical protein